jgi:UDP-N-acetyl-D-mannosaminuronate dehydrogenase
LYAPAIVDKQAKLRYRLGYGGLPIALAFARKSSVVGFDINEARVG